MNAHMKPVSEPIYETTFAMKDDRGVAQTGELYGYMDIKGEIVIPGECESAANFSEGLACV